MNRREARQFNISVEGENCDKLYFDHLKKLINNSEQSEYNMRTDPKVLSPYEFAKRISHKPKERKKNGGMILYIHIQDIEDYSSEFHRKKFYSLIDEIRKTEIDFKITYLLGYSNYTFELWMLLHVADMRHPIPERSSYLEYINRYFHRSYSYITVLRIWECELLKKNLSNTLERINRSLGFASGTRMEVYQNDKS